VLLLAPVQAVQRLLAAYKQAASNHCLSELTFEQYVSSGTLLRECMCNRALVWGRDQYWSGADFSLLVGASCNLTPRGVGLGMKVRAVGKLCDEFDRETSKQILGLEEVRVHNENLLSL